MNDTTTTAAPADYVDDLTSGLIFHRIALSHRSADALGYYPMVTAPAYARTLAALARAAAMGDVYAEAAYLATSKISPYLNGHLIVAGVATAFARHVTNGWIDVRRITGPEPGRPSDHHHRINLAQAATLACIVNEVTHAHDDLGTTRGIGWALAAVIRDNDVTIHPAYLPATAAQITA